MEVIMRVAVKKLALMAVLTAAALIVFIIEAQIPLPVSVPGVKLGLANVVTLFALFYKRKDEGGAHVFTIPDALMILLCRVALGAAFSGSALAFIYSITGGLAGFAAQAALKMFVTERQIWVCGVAGAVFHNLGQILAAVLITGTPYIAALLPILTTAGILTGIITGLAAQFAVTRLK